MTGSHALDALVYGVERSFLQFSVLVDGLVRIPHSPQATLLIDEANPARDRLFGQVTKKLLSVWLVVRER